MKTKHKGIYQPPTSSVVEMNTQGMVCASQFNVVFLLTDESEINWDREGYGSATTDTWN